MTVSALIGPSTFQLNYHLGPIGLPRCDVKGRGGGEGGLQWAGWSWSGLPGVDWSVNCTPSSSSRAALLSPLATPRPERVVCIVRTIPTNACLVLCARIPDGAASREKVRRRYSAFPARGVYRYSAAAASWSSLLAAHTLIFPSTFGVEVRN